ncbi:MAG: S-layer homology domain-containing protein [Peptococcaceae bacterium]|nr:S-layer homology domain-containing protein [Peptococcaceae bacterium]
MSDSIQVTNWANAFKNNKPNSDIPRYFYFSSDNVYGRIDERPVYAITNGGTFAEDTNFASDALATPIKDGYIFDGWYTKNGVENNDWGNPVSKIEADGHYYAKWTPSNDYSINDKSVALEMTYGDDAISKTVSVTGPENDASIKDATSSSKAFEVSRDGMTVTITAADGLNAGTYTGTVYVYTGDGASHRIDVSLTVKKAMLNATYQGETIRVGETPALTVEVKGFVNGETADTATGYTAPTVSTDKTAVGSYELTPVGGEATNYDFEYVPGTLTIEVAPSTGPATYAIGVADADHGTVAVNPTKAVRGKTVTITAKADAGYEVDAVKVTNRNGKAVKVTANSDGTYSFTMPASKVDVSVSFKAVSVDPQPQPTPENPFTDVADDAFYHDAVLWAVDNKITNGTSATTFSPNLACTRAQMICFLWNQAGQPAPKGEEMPFTDVAEGTYYHDAVQWAVEEGLAAGTSSTTFSPNATLTRGQTVTFLWRAAGEPAVNADNSFTDVADSAYYADAVAWAVENGVTNGTATNTFSPDADCTRGQIVTFLWRAAK